MLLYEMHGYYSQLIRRVVSHFIHFWVFRKEIVNAILLNHLFENPSKGNLSHIAMKDYHPMFNLMMLETLRYSQRSKVDVRSLKRIQGAFLLSAKLIYMTNVLKLSWVLGSCKFIDVF